MRGEGGLARGELQVNGSCFVLYGQSLAAGSVLPAGARLPAGEKWEATGMRHTGTRGTWVLSEPCCASHRGPGAPGAPASCSDPRGTGLLSPRAPLTHLLGECEQRAWVQDG